MRSHSTTVLATLALAASGCSLSFDFNNPVENQAPESIAGRAVREAEGTGEFEPVHPCRAAIRRTPISAATTDDGRFILRNIPAGEHELILHCDPDGDGNFDLKLRRPGIRLADNDAVTLGDLVVLRTGSVAGLVTLNAVPVGAGVGVLLENSVTGEATDLASITNPQGRYRIDYVPPGEYTVFAATGTAVGEELPVQVEETKVSDADVVLEEFIELGAIRGHARLWDVPGNEDHAGIHIGASLGGSEQGAETTASDGSYLIQSLQAGIYNVAATVAGHHDGNMAAVPVRPGGEPTVVPDIYLVSRDLLDCDADGIEDSLDDDDDNDGVPNAEDEFRCNPDEWANHDDDPIGDQADPDDDNDNLLDWEDACPHIQAFTADGCPGTADLPVEAEAQAEADADAADADAAGEADADATEGASEAEAPEGEGSEATEAQPCVDDLHEPNDSFVAPSTIGTDETIDSLVSAFGDDDVFEIATCVGATLTVVATFTHAEGDIDLKLLDSDGLEISSAESADDNETLNWVSDLGGSVYIQVTNSTPDACTDYTLATSRTACAPTCTDSEQNQDESDVDCGGTICPKCADGKACDDAADCQSDICSSLICVGAGCTNTEQDGTETDVDCGGGACPPCADGLNCDVAADCQSGVCSDMDGSQSCAVPSCTDGVPNGNETDQDCGGQDCVALGQRCSWGQGCAINADCVSDVCNGVSCQATCSDGEQNFGESDVDCGGPNCGVCPDGSTCAAGSDCSSGVCNVTCQAPNCTDGVHNGNETDLDCGGPDCRPLPRLCAIGQECAVPGDCASDSCGGGGPLYCQESCTDGLENNGETDIDCGGPNCAGCEDGLVCGDATDCLGGICADLACATAPNCQWILDQGHSTGDGVYLIDPDGAGGLDRFDARCDMTTDMGGWTLVLNYLHQGGTSPALDVRTIDLPLQGATTLGGDESGSNTWGHAGNAMMALLDATEIRWRGISSGHPNLMDFKTHDSYCIEYLETGTGDCYGLTDTWQALPGHGTMLPGMMSGYEMDQGDQAMTYNPFSESTISAWGINANGGWTMDESPMVGNTNHTHHQVWARHIPTCDDGVPNQDETDVDCGGTICGPCSAGETCAIGTDCSTGICEGLVCQPSYDTILIATQILANTEGFSAYKEFCVQGATPYTAGPQSWTLNCDTGMSTSYDYFGINGNITDITVESYVPSDPDIPITRAAVNLLPFSSPYRVQWEEYVQVTSDQFMYIDDPVYADAMLDRIYHVLGNRRPTTDLASLAGSYVGRVDASRYYAGIQPFDRATTGHLNFTLDGLGNISDLYLEVKFPPSDTLMVEIGTGSVLADGTFDVTGFALGFMPGNGNVLDLAVKGAVFHDDWIGGVLGADDTDDEYAESVVGSWRAWSEDLCSDGQLNGDETDLDCGGACSLHDRASYGCPDFQSCIVDEDCVIGHFCMGGTCGQV